MVMITIEDLSLSLPGFALKNINLHIERGTHLFLLGPSGSGKTLLLETIAGLHPAASGRVLIGGSDMTALPPEIRGIGLLYQDYALFPHMTVQKNVQFGLKAQGRPEREREKISRDLLDLFGLGQLAARYPGNLSGGERQRVALARALAAGQEILLLDEPFAAIDPEQRARFIDELQAFVHDKELTVIQVSHSREEAYALADAVAVMMNGEIVQSGLREDVFTRPRATGIARFLGFENLLPCTVVGSHDGKMFLKSGAFSFRAPGAIPGRTGVTACIRAGDILISTGEHRVPGGMSSAWGVVTSLAGEEHGVRVSLDCGVPVVGWLSWREQDIAGLHCGQRVAVSVSDNDIHLAMDTISGIARDGGHPNPGDGI